MKRFRQASAAQFEDLQRRARESCVRFFDVELPPGATPQCAMIGFQIDRPTGAASLLVQRGVTYSGNSRELREWFRYGEVVCRDFTELREWLLRNVCGAFSPTESPQIQADSPAAAELTDLPAIIRDTRVGTHATYLSSEDIAKALASHVCGQSGAIMELASRVSRHLARVNPARPLTMMAVGPTGTGKTKAAETLSSVLRNLDPPDARYAYLRIDCSELTESHRVSQLLGAPPGYVGHGDGAQLIDQLAATPRTLVLFDEIEKAHADVFKVLLNAIDCGRLTGSSRLTRGRAVDARDAIFYFTTNLESDGILTELDLRGCFEKPEIIQNVCRGRLSGAGLRPELVGRITSFLVFGHLSLEVKAEIAALSVVRVAAEYGLRVERIESETIVAMLSAERTADFGARPIEFLIDSNLGDEFARAAQAGIAGPAHVKGAGPFIVEPAAVTSTHEQ